MKVSTSTQTSSNSWAPLRNPIFRWLWIASIASNVGTWMQEVGAGWLMTSLSTSPLMVSMVQVAASVPIFLLALPAGALADIVDKRPYLLVVQSCMAFFAMVLAILTFLGVMTPTLLLLLTLVLGAGTALTMPAWSALVPELVATDDLPGAIALSGVGINVARALGPAIAGLILSAFGTWVTFAVNALSFIGVILVLGLWRREPRQTILPAERLFSAMKIGLRYVRSYRPLQRVLFRTFAFFLGASACVSLLPIIVKHELNGSAFQYGILLGCVGVGAVTGAVFLPALRRYTSASMLVSIGSLVYSLVLLLLAWIPNYYFLIVVMLVSGVSWIAVLSSLQISAQTSVPSWVRARAISVYMLFFFGSMAAGGALWGGLASYVSISLVLTAAAVTMVVGIIAGLRCYLPVVTSDDLAPSLHWPQPVLSYGVSNEHVPVLVTLEYAIEVSNSALFISAMKELSLVRQRNGAFGWQLMQDSQNPELWIELFYDESWTQHLRHHDRVTHAEVNIESEVRKYQIPDVDLRIRHYIKNKDVYG